MEGRWTPERRAVLRALCDTYAAPVDPPAVEADDPTGFWHRAASDLDVARHVAAHVETRLPAEDRDGMLRLLDLLRVLGFRHLPQPAREALLRTLQRSPRVAEGLDGYRGLTLANFYGRPGPGRRNPNWDQFGYPGPPDVLERTPRVVSPYVPDGPGDAVLDADVVVVGSGSGGGVVAGELAAAGLDVVVLEAGGHHEDVDFPPDELAALEELYWRGGVQSTEDGNVAILAGATLGGGSTINWMNCVRPPAPVRAVWADEHGVKGLDGTDFDEHLDAVLTRISATDRASELNGPNRRLAEGADALGWSWSVAQRNVDVSTYDPSSAGHVGFGDRSGSKQGTLRTYLRDAAAAGARLLVRCRAQRVLVDAGRAAGVEASYERPDGRAVAVTVRAPRVVVAGGALETPALLLRSGIGGPAAGRYLRVHPVPNIPGFYREPQEAWWGPPQTAIVDEHRDAVDGHGFLVETPHLHVAVAAAFVPWRSARDHKLVVGRSSNLASFLAVNRERGAGRVTVDARGEAVVTYPVDDPLDQRLVRRSVEAIVRLHAAAGAQAIVDVTPDRPVWRRGEDLDAFVERVTASPLGKGGRVLFTAHQMGTARMGTDPETSVADPEGQLHDVRGVWIGDTSAFPTAVGSNPMVTCMALARRTAHAIVAAG